MIFGLHCPVGNSDKLCQFASLGRVFSQFWKLYSACIRARCFTIMEHVLRLNSCAFFFANLEAVLRLNSIALFHNSGSCIPLAFGRVVSQFWKLYSACIRGRFFANLEAILLLHLLGFFWQFWKLYSSCNRARFLFRKSGSCTPLAFGRVLFAILEVVLYLHSCAFFHSS